MKVSLVRLSSVLDNGPVGRRVKRMETETVIIRLCPLSPTVVVYFHPVLSSQAARVLPNDKLAIHNSGVVRYRIDRTHSGYHHTQ